MLLSYGAQDCFFANAFGEGVLDDLVGLNAGEFVGDLPLPPAP